MQQDLEADGPAAEPARRHAELTRAILRAYNLTGPAQTDAIRLVGATLHGYISLELAGSFRHTPRHQRLLAHRTHRPSHPPHQLAARLAPRARGWCLELSEGGGMMGMSDRAGVEAAVEALRKIGYFLERERQPTHRVKAYRRAADTSRVAAGRGAGAAAGRTLTELAGIGPKTEAVIIQAMDGAVPSYLVKLEQAAGS